MLKIRNFPLKLSAQTNFLIVKITLGGTSPAVPRQLPGSSPPTLGPHGPQLGPHGAQNLENASFAVLRYDLPGLSEEAPTPTAEAKKEEAPSAATEEIAARSSGSDFF